MKKLLIILSFQLAVFAAFAQADSTKVEQYCQIIATPRLLSNKVTIDIDFGEEKKLLVRYPNQKLRWKIEEI